MRSSFFISFEGIDGSGKSTQIKKCADLLQRRGRQVKVVREPGDTPLGEQLREIVLNGEDVSPWAEASLFAAARAELVAKVIRPTLESGIDVLCDRFIDSSLAYQAIGRGLDFGEVLSWNLASIEGLVPDLTFVLLLPAEDASYRLGVQLRLFSEDGAAGPPDRLERESLAYRRRVDEGYRELAKQYPERIIQLDGRRAPYQVTREIEKQMKRLLKSGHALSTPACS